MAIYEVEDNNLRVIRETSYSKVNIKEREDLQRLLKAQIDIIAPGCLVIAEEFGNWADSRRRIDLLCIDQDANLVVVELKRTDDGGHMDLQAIRYAAMISTMTFENAVFSFKDYLEINEIEGDAEQLILEFLGWTEPDEENFGQDVRIILASAEFSKEVTSSVLWLNERDLDIRCVRLKPYQDGDRVLIDVQQVIPLPETEEFQIQIKEKLKEERSRRISGRDMGRFNVVVGELTLENLPKRRTIFEVISHLCTSGITPEDIQTIITFKKGLFHCIDGQLDGAEFRAISTENFILLGQNPKRIKSYFSDDEQLIYANGNTYALTKKWGRVTEDALKLLKQNYPDISFDWKRIV